MSGTNTSTPLVAGDMAARSPTDGSEVWRGRSAGRAEIDHAVASARSTFLTWRGRSFAQRADVLRHFERVMQANRGRLVESICQSTGKPRWEAGTEVDAMIGKVGLTITAATERTGDRLYDLPGGVQGETRHRPHGVCAVLGPFNFPGHLPNGHILPAVLAGNTVVYKPSEWTPAVAAVYAELWREAGAPAGVLNVVHGGPGVGAAISEHDDIDAILFTGSRAAGGAIMRSNLDRPGRLLALEMGGNNPLIAWNCGERTVAAYHIILSAFISAGQRCSCARRLIVHRDDHRLLDELVRMTRVLHIGAWTKSPEPFAGPMISGPARERASARVAELKSAGGVPLLAGGAMSVPGFFFAPAIIDCTSIPQTERARFDDECFGPVLQVIRVSDFDHAIAEANATRFGLAAGLLSDDAAAWEQFQFHARAGVINWNRPTTGASSALPFGGVGESGNHRPSGFFAADYCSYPVAMMRSSKLTLPTNISPGITL